MPKPLAFLALAAVALTTGPVLADTVPSVQRNYTNLLLVQKPKPPVPPQCLSCPPLGGSLSGKLNPGVLQGLNPQPLPPKELWIR
ncbi:hypothetical protein [Azospirillum soli]|uniref:hypothetical protein n=1 Tax=Azospirillum soli TaxID=1304799 RepID=UPI001AE76221|nr:hypothetical protein [Azospirillum soli]MBP2313090.1 hypothetical protein [Azospirillum soli]